ncbi:MAG: hypothetical protein HWD89_12320 [Tenacibaculum sp.]|uniref:phosphoribosyltransferase-like protein n=1 Tax=Tenacibaculum sp. TaxID=1906242 RepID=UPI001828E1FF|nr:hypothetical protein [Tenacibaculum sp.]NVK09828.1 hypothetical protein [Tenacibaculum sp.]
MKKKIDIDIVMKLYALFADKKWNEIEGNKKVFENFCKLTDNLTQEQTELIFELTERYKWITYNEYNSRLTSILKSIYDDYGKNVKKIYLFPIIKPEDEEKIKSGNNIIYMMRGIKPFIEDYDKITFVELNKFELLTKDNLKLKNNEVLLLVDDYVGSGETLKATLTEVFKNKTLTKDKIIVSSIILQNDSFEFLNNIGIKSYSSDNVIKEISQFYESPALEEKIKIMEEIEQLIPGGNNFSFGYEQSEALVTMIRTPDNTFPIFWKEHRKNGQKYKAPFPRY